MQRGGLTPNWLMLLVLLTSFLSLSTGENNSMEIVTDECFLTEPVYNHKFDFSSIHSDMAHVVTSTQGHIFEYNICGNLTRACDGQSNVSACLRKGDKEHVLGIQQQLKYKNGKMYFSYSNGAKCKGDKLYQLHVFLSCDYTLDSKQSQITPYMDDQCSFYITLETPHACLPEPDNVKSNTCTVKDIHNGHNYDFMSLSDFNYRTSDRNGNAFIINVCKPVLYGENAMCPPGSSICLLNLTSTDIHQKFRNYGSAQANPEIENGKIFMRHNSNTPCNATTNYTSIIYFYCDKEVRNAHPELIGLQDCVYQFSFVTPLACNNTPECSVITHGNELLDLRPLQKHPTLELSWENKVYYVGICTEAGLRCKETDGSCSFANNQAVSLGIANSHLRIVPSGSPYLEYEGGALCQPQTESSVEKYWYTRIEFICANNVTKSNTSQVATIVENSNCRVLIHYRTPLACQEQITCKTKVYVEHSEDGSGQEIVDLTPLISSTENYEAKIDENGITLQQVDKSTKFYLNVCRPLIPKYSLGCPGGSAACMAKVVASTGRAEEEMSLGYPLVSLVASNRTTAELLYQQGSPCPSDKNSQLSTGIKFTCNMRAGRGIPVLRSISECHYQFTWATNVICPPHNCNFNAKTCEIINEEINDNYSLKKAAFTNDGKIKIQRGNDEHWLNICVEHLKAVTDYSQGLMNLFFRTQGPCGTDGLINVQMRLICSNETHYESTLNDDKECNLLYVQRTPDICKFLEMDIPKNAGKNDGENVTKKSESGDQITTKKAQTPLEGHPAENTASIGAILAGILSLTCFVACFGILAFSPERRTALRRLFSRSSSAVRYSRVQSAEEANLLLEPNGEFTDSDDDMLL